MDKTNNNEYVVWYIRDSNDMWTLTDTPVFAMSYEDGSVTMAGSKSMRDSYSEYFQKSSEWKDRHLKSGYPLSSFLGGNPYSPIKFLSGADSKAQFIKAVSQIKGGTTTIGRGNYSKVKVVKSNEV